MPIEPLLDNAKKTQLQQRLLMVSYANLLLVTLLGILLRTFPFLSSFPLSYKNILHGHSHFAFTGWVMLVLFALLMKSFPLIRERIAYRHWRNMAGLILLSSYGMLVAFPLQGYKAISISFSTLAIAATVYLTVMVTRALEALPKTTSHCFIKWSLFYATLSSIGPLALGPLMAMGKSGSTLYFDAIYFYLHFQYNGFFTFMVLALLYRRLEHNGAVSHGKKVFLLLNGALVPAYALSVLWHQPYMVFNWIGGSAALLQLAAVYYLLKDVCTGLFKNAMLLKLSLAALIVKCLLQVASAVPFLARLAYEHRNLVIAYLHLVLLGFVSLFVFAYSLQQGKRMKVGVGLFIFSFFSTESLLVLQAAGAYFSFSLSYFTEIMLICSVCFPAGVALIVRSIQVQGITYGSTIQNNFVSAAAD